MAKFMYLFAIIFSLASFAQLPQESPILYNGSTFGAYFQALQNIGNYEKMLALTSESTRKKFGDSKLLDFYREMDFSYLLTLKAEKDGVLYYSTTIFGTQKTIQLMYSIDRGKVKIVFDFLNPQKPFTGI